MSENNEDDLSSIPLVDEEVSVRKERVLTGKVRISTRTETSEQLVSAVLHGEDVEITRVPVGREVAEVPEIRSEGDLTILPVVEEVLVVEKRLVLKEEVHIRRKVTTEQFETPVTVRSQRAIVQRLNADGSKE